MNGNLAKKPVDQYKEIQIKTAGQGKLIVMLYDGIINNLEQAKEYISKKNIQESHNKIVKAQDIIMELIFSLNMEAGEIAQKLYSLYMYFHKRLLEANIYKDPKIIDEVLKMVKELREVWAQVVKKPESYSKTEPGETGINIKG